jgi:hypothetical protein
MAPPVSWAVETYTTRVKHKRPPATYRSARYASLTHFFDNSKSVRELGVPVTPLRETIEKSVRWYRENGFA